jgi:hypothetical protein
MPKQLCVLVFCTYERVRAWWCKGTTTYTFAVLGSFQTSLVSCAADDVVCHGIVLLAMCEQVVSLADEDTVSTLLSLYISCVKQVNTTSHMLSHTKTPMHVRARIFTQCEVNIVH